MPKDTSSIELVWTEVEEQNPGLGDWLDKAVRKGDLSECWPYNRERLREKDSDLRPRKTIKYNGKKIEVSVARLIVARVNGRTPADQDAAHLCLRSKFCCNPDHLVMLSRSIHMTMDKTLENEIRRMEERCPDGQIRMIVIPASAIKGRTSLPEGWPTDEEIETELTELAEEDEIQNIA